MKNLSKISNNQVSNLCDFMNKLRSEDHELEHYELEDDAGKISEVLKEQRYQFCISIINDKYIGISSPGFDLDDKNIIKLTKWLIDQGLNNHLFAISCEFYTVDSIRPFPNLVSVELSLENKNENHTTLNNLRNIYISRTDININLSCVKFNKKAIKFLDVTKVPVVDVKKINSLINLEELRIVNSNFSSAPDKLVLPELKSFASTTEFTIDFLSECKNLKIISGNLNTSIDHSNIENKITSITLIGYPTLNLNNIYTEKLEILLAFDSGLTVNKQCNSLKYLNISKHNLHYNKRRDRTDYKEFFLSSVTFFPNIDRLEVYGLEIIDDTDATYKNLSLRIFYLRGSDTSNIKFLIKFPLIQSLYITYCNIENIEILEKLNDLKDINLSGNKIIDIPPILAQRFIIKADEEQSDLKDTSYLIVGNNPLISPPIEIVERGESAVGPYFNSMLGEMEELNEAKIIFLGNGEVGKTSLMKALSGQAFNTEEATTHGINICRYSVPINEQRTIVASIWDFGGQQIMHATHQLFLSRRCIYVLVINDRRDDLQQEQKIEYWLQQVQTFGGDSKVLIVRNKSDMFSLNNVPEGKLKEKFPNLIAIESVSCKTGDNIERVKNLLNEQVRQLPMRKVCLAKNWIRVKEDIKQLSHEKDHLPLTTYTDICVSNGVTDIEAQNTLRQLLHDLSVIIAFEELSDFDMGILNPHWITDGIYTIINSDSLEGNNGYIKITEVQQELDRMHPNKYKNKARFIIESMMHFELCHSVGISTNNTYLVPNLLPNEVRDSAFKTGENTIRFLFKYENLLPPALFPKLLVRMNNQIAPDKRWRTGAIMHDVSLEAQAKVEVDSVAKEIKIIVTGRQTRDFFTIIRHHIRNLNIPNTEALGVRELVPLEDSGEYIDYDELIGLEVMGETDYISGKLKRSFAVSSLLNGIESRVETERYLAKQRGDIKLSVEVKTGAVNVTTGNFTNTMTSSSEQTQTANQSQAIDISLELKGLKGTADYVLEDLKDEAESEIVNERDRVRFIKECDKVKYAIEKIENVDTPEKASENLGHFSRIRDFLSNAIEGTGNVGNAIQSLGDTISKVRDLAKKYNKIANFLGLPIVPEILL